MPDLIDHPMVKSYLAAVAFSNKATLAKFGVHGPYESDSPERAYWLTQLDAYYGYAAD